MAKRGEILAAGTVVLRGEGSDCEVLVVHRPAYDDWSLPKGKLNPDEYGPVAAVRETLEETGYRARLLARLPDSRYEVAGRRKTVEWWLAAATDDPVADHDGEADLIEWWSVAQAIARLSYPDDVRILTEALRVPPGVPFIIVRHSKAMARRQWKGPDCDRRLTERGRRQAKALADVFAAFGVRHLVSSSATRCVRTLTPYAQRTGLDVQTFTELSEESAAADPDGVTWAMSQVRAIAQASGEPLALCGHRPVLPVMLDFLGIALHKTPKPAEVIVFSMSERGQARATAHIAPKL